MKRITLFLFVIFAGFLAFSQGPGDLTEDQKIRLENERPNVENSVRLNPTQKSSLVSPLMQIPVSVNRSGALKARDGKNISVLVASPNAADFNTHVLPTMQTFGGVTYTATSALGALTVDEMLSYDVVWTFNVSTWQTETGTTAVEWSNKLGNFITQGGYLVESQFVNSYDEWGLGSGLYITGNMSPFIKSTLDRPTGTFNLGGVLIPSHPIMSGVTQVSTTYFVQNVVARSNATLIANWGNAQADPLVAAYDNIVAFNADPVMSTGSVMQPGITGDGFLMFHNAIVWLYNNQADPLSPAAPTALTATAGAMGALSVELGWTNPTTTFDGSPLTAITAVKIHREGTLIHTINNPAPGAVLAYTDNTMTTPGIYNYTVTAENAVGEGPAAGVSVYVGEDLPGAPGNVTLVGQGNNGFVTWTAPTAGLNGGYLNPAGLNYKVVRMPGNVEVASGLTVTEYLDNTVPGIGNYYYTVTASNTLGVGGSANSNIALLGAEGVLMYETFNYATGALPPGWTVDGMGQTNWAVNNSNLAGGTAPELRFTYTPTFIGLTRIISPPVNVESGQALKFNFRQFLSNYSTNQGEIAAIDVSYDGGTTWAPIWQQEITANIPAGIYELFINVPAGKTSMHLGFRFEGNSFNINQWYFDNLTLEPVVDHDLVGVSITGNATPTAGSESIYTVTVRNGGNMAASAYTVKLMMQGGIELASVPGTPLEFTQTGTFQIPWTPAVDAEGPTYLYGYVDYPADQVPGNNQTSNLNVVVQAGGTVAVSIGTGDLNLYMPYNFLYHHSLSQTLYYPDEIGISGGLITALQYKSFFNAEYMDREIQIWIGETALNDLSAGWVDPASLQLVFSGTVDFLTGTNDVLIPLDAPYVYGGGNLVIYSHKSDVVWSGSKFFKGSTTAGSNRSRRAQQDNTPMNPASPPAGLVNNDFPNIVMYFSTAGLGSLEGVVTDGTDPLQGVHLNVEGTTISTTTNADGEYSFPFLAAGNHVLLANLTGYTEVSLPFTIVADETTVLNIELAPLTKVSVSGFVAGSQAPTVGLEGAMVHLGGYGDFETLTDANGNFVFPEVFANQSYTIHVEADSHIPYNGAFELGEVDLVLDDIILEYTDVVEIGIGDGIVLAYQPINFYYDHSITQTLYFPDEIGMGGGVITALKYFYNFTQPQLNKEVKIYLGETDAADLSAGWVDPSSLELVFDGMLNFPSGIQNIIIELDDIYVYSGGNLVVYVHKADGSYVAGQNFLNTNDPGSNRTRRAQRDGTPIDPLNPGIAGAANSDFPNIVLFISTAGLGGLEGAVSDDGEPLEGVLVSVLGTNAKTYTDAEGLYAFPYLLAGTYDVKFELFGYYEFIEEGVIIVEQETATLDVELMAIPTVTVSGFVGGSDYPTVGLEGAVVKLTGYDNYEVMTNADGEFEFAGVYVNNTYAITVAFAGYEPYAGEVVVEATDLVLANIILNEIALPVSNVVAVEVEEGVHVSWEEPSPAMEFRYDDGVVDGQLGFQGTWNSVMGAVHHRNAQLQEMTWMLTSEGGPHNTVKVWVLGLTATGTPDRNNVLYSAEAVPNVDGQWNTYTFPNPIDAPNGFFMGLSYNGFLGLAIDDGVGDPWAFVPATQYGVFNITDPASLFTPIENWDFQVNYLLRGFGLDFGPAKTQGKQMADAAPVGPAPERGELKPAFEAGEPTYTYVPDMELLLRGKALEVFNIYRFLVADQANPAAWTSVATGVEEWEYLDEDWYELPVGVYKYAVVAEYTNGVLAPAALSNELALGMSAAVTVNVTTNSGDSPAGAVLVLTNLNGNPDHVYTMTAPANGVVVFPAVWLGTYNLSITLTGFNTFTQNNIVVADVLTIPAVLVETIVPPYGLVVVEGVNAGEAHLSWNNVMAEELSENFEGTVFPPEGWAKLNPDGGTGWEIINVGTTPLPGWNGGVAEAAPNGGTKMVFASWEQGGATANDQWLITPQIVAAEGFEFSFYLRYWPDTYPDQVDIRISTTDQNSTAAFNVVVANLTFSTGSSTNWVHYTYNLTDFVPSGTSVYVAFREHVLDNYNDGAAIMLDNVYYGPAKKHAQPEPLVHNELHSITARDFDYVKAPTQDTRAFVSYNVFLDNLTTPVATGVTTTEFLFTGLANGNYVAGVQSVYTTGASEVVTQPFTITNGVVEETHMVTFRVHMHAVTFVPGTDVVYISGEFPQWVEPGQNPDFLMQTTDDPMILTLTLELDAGDYEYKYFKGTGWNNGEWPGSPDRVITVTGDMTVNNVFGNIADPVNVPVVEPGQLLVYPNPVRDVLHIASGQTIREVRIIDMLGQVVYASTVQGERHELNVAGFRNGIYFVQVLTTKGLTTQRIQIVK